MLWPLWCSEPQSFFPLACLHNLASTYYSLALKVFPSLYTLPYPKKNFLSPFLDLHSVTPPVKSLWGLLSPRRSSRLCTQPHYSPTIVLYNYLCIYLPCQNVSCFKKHLLYFIHI